MSQIGLIADIHGDLEGFQSALQLLRDYDVSQVFCAGDIVDRGAGADEIVQLLQLHHITCIRGNHDYSVVHFQEKWRNSVNPQRLAQLGRIISDETVTFLEGLPEQASFMIENTRFLMAHGTPWSDIMAVFPDSRQTLLDRLAEKYQNTTDIMILGHTHMPMDIRLPNLRILNPGSIYGVTIRDSHTCAVLSLLDGEFRVFGLKDGHELDVPAVFRNLPEQG